MMMKTSAWIWTLLAATVILPVGCSGRTDSSATSDAASKTVQTPVATAHRRDVAYEREVTGMIQSPVKATVSAKMMGRIERVVVAEGDAVAPGDLLIQIDDRALQAGLDQAGASLAAAKNAEKSAYAGVQAAEAGAALACTTLRRFEQLLAQQSVSPQEFDEVEAHCRQANAALEQARERLKAARNQVDQAVAAESATAIHLQDAAIRAPFAGTITARRVDPGDLAAPGMPLLEMEKAAGKQVHAYFPASLLAQVKPAQAVTVSIPVAAVENLPGRIRTISPVADPHNRSFLVKIDIPGQETLRSGMFARVRVKLAVENILQIPVSAIVRHGQLEGVFLVDGDHIARFRLVRTGKRSGAQVAVFSGIQEGDRYVPAPPPNLKDGDRVEAE